MYKRNSLITLLFICISTVFFAQSAKNKSTPPQENVVLAPEKAQQIQKQIAQIDGHFQAIESKKSYVLADSVETVKALESGWFEDMEGIQQRLLDRKTSLLLILNDGQHE